MDRSRLALLDASFAASTRRNFRRELDAELVEFDVPAGELPSTFEFDGVVVTGSKASVYEDEAWIESLLDWLAESADRGLPMLGVCFGHQALAAALGGSVEPMGAYEIGYSAVDRMGESMLLDGLDDSFTVFTTHRDTVTELPPGATPIAANEYGLHGFERGHVFTVQFHPEYDMATAEEITRSKDLEVERREAVLDGITEANYAAACEVKGLFENFTAYVRERRVGATTMA